MSDEELLREAKEAIDAHLQTQTNLVAKKNQRMVAISNRISERLGMGLKR